MLKKILFVLVCMALMLGASSSAALAGNGVPPVVVNPQDGGECIMWWVKWTHDRSVYTGVPIIGTISFVYQPSTGFWTSTCQLTIDFDNPMMATIDEACAIAESILPEIVDCKNNLYVMKGFDCWLNDMVTTDSLLTVNPNGVAVVTCKYYAP